MKYVLKQLKSDIKINGIANLHYFEFPEHYYTIPDKHPFNELLFVVNGSLEIKSENFNGILEKDCLLIHSANEVHALNTVDNQAPTVIIIGFSCDNEKIKNFAKKPIKLDDTEIKTLAEIIKEGRNVFLPPYDVPKYDMQKRKNMVFGAEQMLENLLEYFLICIVRKFENAFSSKEKVLDFSTFNIKEILTYIDQNFNEKITIDELAFLFRTNRSTLCKEFKKLTGQTIINYISDKKLCLAKQLILSTNLSFTQIAEQLNFDSIHYFTRFFKKMTGLSPKQFRQKNGL